MHLLSPESPSRTLQIIQMNDGLEKLKQRLGSAYSTADLSRYLKLAKNDVTKAMALIMEEENRKKNVHVEFGFLFSGHSYAC